MTNLEYGTDLLREFLKINTSNPPGNEEEAVKFLERPIREAGIATEVFSAAPKRVNLLARIRGRSSAKPIILLSHTDVVPANSAEWAVDPFGGELKDGFIYGRGAIDMKAQTIFQLLAFIRLHEEGIVPETDILFLATCDEEVGGKYGVEYMLNEVVDLRNASFVLSEGGFIVEENGQLHAQVAVAEKKLSQFLIRASGTGGHGSVPHRDNANVKVIDAAKTIMSHDWPFKPTAIASTYLNGVLKGVKGYPFRNLKDALKNKKFRAFVETNPLYNAMLRNTVTPTMLKGGDKINVIPTESYIYFDARLLPTESHEAFFKTIRRLAGKDVEVLPVGTGINSPAPSSHNTRYFKAIRDITRRLKGPMPVLPSITTGATDLRYFRGFGIPSYGFLPITLSKDEFLRMHGKDERISLDNVREGIVGTYEIVKFLAT